MKIKRVNLPNFINAFFTPLTPHTVWVNKKKHHIEHLIEQEAYARQDKKELEMKGI
jgi:hypothetical protein